MEKIFTYINTRRLEGDELDKDFEEKCKSNGATDDSKIEAVKINTITGHNAWIITITNSEEENSINAN